MQASSFAAAEPPLPAVKLLHCRKEAGISAADSKISAWAWTVASVHGQLAIAALCWCVIHHRSNFIHQPGAWNNGNHSISSIRSADRKSWNPSVKLHESCKVWVRFPLPRRTPCLVVPFEQKGWPAKLKAMPFTRGRNCSSQGVGKASGSNEWRCWLIHPARQNTPQLHCY